MNSGGRAGDQGRLSRLVNSVFAALYKADGSIEAPRGSAVVQAGTTVLLVSRAGEVAEAVKAMTDPAL